MSLRSHSDVTCDVISYHWQCKIGVKSEWRFHQKTNSYSMEGREPSFSLICFSFCRCLQCFVGFVCLYFSSFKTLLIQMDFQQNIGKGSCIYHIIKNLELEIDFILKDKFENISKKVPFLPNIAKFPSYYSWGSPLFVCDVMLSWRQIFLVIGKQQREGRCVCVYL